MVTGARVVCRSRSKIAPLPHVHAFVASFLAPPASWTIARAVRSGYAHLADVLITALAGDLTVQNLDKRARARMGVHAAASTGDVELIQRLVDTFGCAVDEWAIRDATRGGHFEALQLLYHYSQQQDIVVPAKMLLPLAAVGEASKAGSLAMVQWIYQVRGDVAPIVWPLELPTSGGLPIVEWLWSQSPRAQPLSTKEVEEAADGGHEDVLQFLHARQPLEISSWAINYAAANGHLELAQWMHSISGKSGTDKGVYLSAQNGHLTSVRWLYRTVELSDYHFAQALEAAAQHGHLEIIKFLCESRPGALTHAVMNPAAENNHMNILDYLGSKDGEGCSRAAMDSAARNGHLDMVKWLHENYPDIGCSTDAMDDAATNGHLEVVRWLNSNRCEGCTTSAMDGAARRGHLDVVKWLHAHRSEGCTARAMSGAIGIGRLDIIVFLHENGWVRFAIRPMATAAKLGNVRMLKWLHQNRMVSSTDDTLIFTARYSHHLAFKWLNENLFNQQIRARLVADPGVLKCAVQSMVASSDFDMLEWFYRREYLVVCVHDAALYTAAKGNIEVLEWIFARFSEKKTIEGARTEANVARC